MKDMKNLFRAFNFENEDFWNFLLKFFFSQKFLNFFFSFFCQNCLKKKNFPYDFNLKNIFGTEHRFGVMFGRKSSTDPKIEIFHNPDSVRSKQFFFPQENFGAQGVNGDFNFDGTNCIFT